MVAGDVAVVDGAMKASNGKEIYVAKESAKVGG
jgi:hypothetical protein